MILKTLVTRLKDIVPYLISSNQAMYVKNRYISESGKLIQTYLKQQVF